MKKKRYEKIAAHLEDLIAEGKLQPKDRLPPERSLAESFGVSRNTVREALKALVEKGVVVSRLGAGTYVAESARDRMARAMAEVVEKRRHRLREVFEMRKILEPQIAGLAAERIDARSLAALEEIVSQQKKALVAGENPVALDERFHRTLVRATGNSVLWSVYEKLHDILAESRTEELQSPERRRVSLEVHMEILDALKSKDAGRAARLMTRHMLQIEKSLSLSETV